MSEVASPLRMPAAPSKSRRRMTRSLTVQSEGPNVPNLSRSIPVPDVPVTPVLSVAAFLSRQTSPIPSILDAGNSVYLPAGRSAIGLALRLAGVEEGDEVLLPAYHCMSMVTPLALVSAKPVFFRIRSDLSVDLEDIARKITPRTKVLLATNYFGVPQELKTIRAFCDERGLVFIEDCAHSFFGGYQGRPIGSYGHYAIGSLTKFFPVRGGGCLVTNDPKAKELSMRGSGFITELRHIYAGLEDATYYRRLSLLRPLIGTVEGARTLLSRKPVEPQDDMPVEPGFSSLDSFDPASVNIKAVSFTRWVSRVASSGRVIQQRRKNFLRMLTYFSRMRDFRTPVTKLPAGCVPYMFPLWVDDLPRIFSQLEDLAVPVQRFGQFLTPGVDETVCPVSVDFSNHGIQLPCHQELREEELNWMMETVSSVIASAR